MFNPFGNKPCLLRVCSTSLLKRQWEKEKLFFWKTFCHFREIWDCRLQTLSVSKGLKFVIWEKGYDEIFIKWSNTSNVVILINKCSLCDHDLKVFKVRGAIIREGAFIRRNTVDRLVMEYKGLWYHLHLICV